MLKRIIGKKKIIMLVLGIIVGILISVMGVYAATLIDSKNVTYTNTTSKLKATNVQDAIDELYTKINIGSQYIINLYNEGNLASIVAAGGENITQAKDVNLMQDSHGNIRYYGANPDNYIKFNNELWRIIDISVGRLNAKNGLRIKIISESIGNQARGSSNNWNNSSTKTYLNNDYYNNLSNDAKNMIDEAIWYLGGVSDGNSSLDSWYPKLYSKDYYIYERGIATYTGNPTLTLSKVGLMYASDYGYATDLSKCSQTIYGYDNENCKSNNWLYDKNSTWTITPFSTSSHDTDVIYGDATGFGGKLSNSGSSNIASIRPVVYLKPNVIITNGTGSKSNPYQIKLV